MLEYGDEYALMVIDEVNNAIPNMTSAKLKEKTINGLIKRDILKHILKVEMVLQFAILLMKSFKIH